MMSPEYSDASLAGIPEEILLNIIKNLKDDQHALAKLCRMDRRCKRIAETLLYKRICYPWDERKSDVICRRPELANYLQDCEFRCEKRRPEDAQILKDAHNIRRLEWIEHDVSCDELGRCFRCYLDLPKPNERLSLLSEIVSLFDKAMNQPSRPDNQFTRLTHLAITLPDNHPLSMELLPSVFLLPALTRLHLSGFRQSTPFQNWTVPASTSLVKELHLTNVWMDSTAAPQVIASIKDLEHFQYEFQIPMKRWQTWMTDEGECRELALQGKDKWENLGQALRQHRNCLETLTLWDVDAAEGYLCNFDPGTLGSFADFPKLKKLAVPIEAFLDVEKSKDDPSLYLPKQLEVLDVTSQTEGTDALLSYLPRMEMLWRPTNASNIKLFVNFEGIAQHDTGGPVPRFVEGLKLLKASELPTLVEVTYRNDVIDIANSVIVSEEY